MIKQVLYVVGCFIGIGVAFHESSVAHAVVAGLFSLGCLFAAATSDCTECLD